MDELIDITYFLTKQGVCKDMQKEIMKYYSQLNHEDESTHILIFFKWDRVYTNYCEIVPKTPIEHLNLFNVYKFLCEDLSGYRREYATATPKELKYKNRIYLTKDLLKKLENQRYLSSKDLPINKLLGIKKDQDIKLCIQYTKIE